MIKCRHILAESPFWHGEENTLFWIDIIKQTLHAYHLLKKETSVINFSSTIGFIVPDNKGNIIVGLQNGIASYDVDKAKLRLLAAVEDTIPENRCNDGKCDSMGRLWFGTMNGDCKPGAGALYLLDRDLKLYKKQHGLTIPNGIAWSLDQKQLYHIDSTKRSVVRYRYDEKSGEISGAKTVIVIPDHLGLPDGMTIDEEGMLWIAHYGGYGVYRWNPVNGTLIDKIAVSVPNVTSCTFGGHQLDTLFITTASQDLDEETLNEFPLSGSIFMVKPGIKGIKANIFMR